MSEGTWGTGHQALIKEVLQRQLRGLLPALGTDNRLDRGRVLQPTVTHLSSPPRVLQKAFLAGRQTELGKLASSLFPPLPPHPASGPSSPQSAGLRVSGGPRCPGPPCTARRAPGQASPPGEPTAPPSRACSAWRSGRTAESGPRAWEPGLASGPRAFCLLPCPALEPGAGCWLLGAQAGLQEETGWEGFQQSPSREPELASSRGGGTGHA